MNIIRRTNQIFPSGANLQINGGQFISAQKVSYPKRSDKGLDILYKHTAPGALLDPKKHFNPPKCDYSTRAVILQTLMDWIVGGDNSSSIMWLHGPAGSGKSDLAQSIAEKCREAGLLAASFFCKNALTSDTSDGRLLITTLVYQLTSSFPRIRPYVQKYIKNNISIFDKGIEAQAENLLVLPVTKVRRSFRYLLARLFSQPNQPRLFVIDGLDRCSDIRTQCEILKVLAKAVRDLSLPFRFLIASRPEAHLYHIFNHDSLLKSVSVRRLNLVHDILAENDIRVYLSSEFEKIIHTHKSKEKFSSSWPGSTAIEALISRTFGQFVYASTVIRYIQSTKHRPADRLQAILGIPADATPSAALDALYTHILSSVDDPVRVMQIVSLLVIPRHTNDGLGSFNSPDMIDEILLFQSGHTQLILTDLSSIVMTQDRYSPIKLYHASLNDFLLDPLRSGDLFVDVPKAYERLARGYLKLSQAEDLLSKDLAQKFDSYFTSFRNAYERATLSVDISSDMEELDFLRIHHYLLSKFSPDIPKYILAGLGIGDAVYLTSFWRMRQLWKSRSMEQLLRPFKRNDLPRQDRIFDAYMHSLYTVYCPTDQIIKESLVLLLAQPRFQDYIFRMCDHTNHDSCKGCQTISPLASALSYQVMYAFMLHPSAALAENWNGDVDMSLGERCAEQAYVCLTFAHSIIDAIVVSHRNAGATKTNASRVEIKARTQHDSYADYYFWAALDCAIILLPHSDHTDKLATVLAKFVVTESWSQDYVLRRFSSQFEQLQPEVAAYRRRSKCNE